ncbi:nuclear fusion protein KAR5 [Podospora aff. communis PSN243]|uniref:Nuclear fusion protein KAR5 n=1 Tax=Podospora aff. communis PSN243 TaxID=3040156 RepID=A0AAV9GZ10_9PEZI|nr:nuclear fusion protein KAR5 [Podospora aff. communis PSN243]
MARSGLQLLLALLAFPVRGIAGFSWRGDNRATRARSQPSEVVYQEPGLQNILSVTLNELQELESEPFCHRVAARLLVNNCQLVDGKDDATILTDSGRQVRDFVDSYAASLAICDLERGNFKIPTECAKFREQSLSQIAIQNEPQLHVSPREIGLCLSGLAASDAAWSTWVSYRHKALRFCEAARGDNEKTQSILVYQKLTKVIARLVEGVEVDLQRRMDELDSRARQTFDNLDKLSPQVDRLRDRLVKVEDYLSSDLANTLKKSTKSTADALQNAEDLKQLLNILVGTVLEQNAQMASAHELSVRQATGETSSEIAALAQVVSMAAASTAELRRQIEISTDRATSLAQQQDFLEQGFERLLVTASTLSSTFDEHIEKLQQATNTTNGLLDALEETTNTAARLTQSLSNIGFGSWLPYILCPTFTVVVGSYGLEPSPLRNFVLGALGEVLGFLISAPSSARLGKDFDFSFLASSNATTPKSL